MVEHSSLHNLDISAADISDDLLDLIYGLLQKIRADISHEVEAEQPSQEWHDINELRATNGQIRLLSAGSGPLRSIASFAVLIYNAV